MDGNKEYLLTYFNRLAQKFDLIVENDRHCKKGKINFANNGYSIYLAYPNENDPSYYFDINNYFRFTDNLSWSISSNTPDVTYEDFEAAVEALHDEKQNLEFTTYLKLKFPSCVEEKELDSSPYL